MRARPRHIAVAVAAVLAIGAGVFLAETAMRHGPPAAPAAETKPAPGTDILSGRSATPTHFVTNGAPPAASVPLPPRRPICRKRHKKREA